MIHSIHGTAMACRAPWLPSPLLNYPARPIPRPRHRHIRHLHHESLAGRATRCTIGSAEGAEASIPRRSADYQPTLWQNNVIQTLMSDHSDEAHMAKLRELTGQVKHLIIGGGGGAAAELELFDLLRRLGVAYHFEQEIELVLNAMFTNLEGVRQKFEGDLLHTALLFRLLREHGLAVPQDVFDSFKDEKGCFRESLSGDVEGLFNLYEASFLAVPGEKGLDEARAFAVNRLKKVLIDGNAEPTVRERVENALEMPLHWRAPRVHARWFIDLCSREGNVIPVLLDLAKLDFNMVQTAHKRDMRAMSRWWEDLGLQGFSFSRDRIVEWFFLSAGAAWERQFWSCRRGLTKAYSLITTIDDVYDVYGSKEELEAFTMAVERWDVDAIEELPDYMKLCLRALFNTTNELAQECFRTNGFNCLPYLKKSWIQLCKSFLLEARWYHSKHTPTLGKYMENALITISGPLIFNHAFFLLSENITSAALDSIENSCDLIRWSSIIFRLTNDLADSTTELERGDVPKSIQCIMHQRTVTEAMAREHIEALISDAWMNINKVCLSNKHFPKAFVKSAVNLVRLAHCIFQNGDGHSAPNKETKNLVSLVLIEPILIN